MADQPTGTSSILVSLIKTSAWRWAAAVVPQAGRARQDLHEAGPTCDHDVFHIRERLELGTACQHRGLFPDAVVLKQSGHAAIGRGCGCTWFVVLVRGPRMDACKAVTNDVPGWPLL